ncbi:MAG: hypothetical protein ACKVS9_07960 [Phycisphaerae bacterium]
MSVHDVVSWPQPRSQTVWWILAVLLAFIAGSVWSSRDGGIAFPQNVAFAQNAPLAGGRGIYAFTGQLDASRHGLFMLDIEQGNVWCYEIETVAGVKKLKLVAARTWLYDRYLKDFNCLPPTFREVEAMIAIQRSQADDDAKSPADAGKPRPDDSKNP